MSNPNPIRKRDLILKGCRTSISLEEPFWESLRQIAAGRGMSVSEFVEGVDAGEGTLSSAVRLAVLDHSQASSRIDGGFKPSPRSWGARIRRRWSERDQHHSRQRDRQHEDAMASLRAAPQCKRGRTSSVPATMTMRAAVSQGRIVILPENSPARQRTSATGESSLSGGPSSPGAPPATPRIGRHIVIWDDLACVGDSCLRSQA